LSFSTKPASSQIQHRDSFISHFIFESVCYIEINKRLIISHVNKQIKQ